MVQTTSLLHPCSISPLLVPVHAAGPSLLSQSLSLEGKTPNSNLNQLGLRAGNLASRSGLWGWGGAGQDPDGLVCLMPGHKRGVVLRRAKGISE